MQRILDLIESVKDRKTLFVGELIEDEYVFVSALGKPSKEPVLAVRAETRELYRGGVEAAAGHAMQFCKAECGNDGVRAKKTRFVDKHFGHKLFEVQQIDDSPYGGPELDLDADVVAVTDFGHGFFTPGMVERFMEAKYLAVCAQTNAANYGFNLITKWPYANYIVIDEPEARLAAHDRESSIENVILQLAQGRCEKMVVTLGKNGAIGWDQARGFFHEPAYSSGVIDTMGAGDAFFAVTSPMAPEGLIEDLLAIGNAAGAVKTGILGHRTSITKEAVIDLLKERHAGRSLP